MNPEELIENNVYIAKVKDHPEWDSMFVFKGLTSNNFAKLQHRIYINRQVGNRQNILLDDGGSWIKDTTFETPSQDLIEWFWKCINNNYYFEKPKYNDNLILFL